MCVFHPVLSVDVLNPDGPRVHLRRHRPPFGRIVSAAACAAGTYTNTDVTAIPASGAVTDMRPAMPRTACYATNFYGVVVMTGVGNGHNIFWGQCCLSSTGTANYIASSVTPSQITAATVFDITADDYCIKFQPTQFGGGVLPTGASRWGANGPTSIDDCLALGSNPVLLFTENSASGVPASSTMPSSAADLRAMRQLV